MPPRRNAEPLDVPTVSWYEILRRLRRLWRVREYPHHSIIGLTGSGKSFLTRHGILDGACQWDRVLYLDGKGDDPTLRGLGNVVNRFPTKLSRGTRKLKQDDEPRGDWFRLITSRRWEVASQQVEEALTMAMDEGEWIVVVDELRYVTDRRIPGLNLGPRWEEIVLRGRSRGVGMVSLTQEPRWVPGSFYSNSQFYWFGAIEDEATHKRISEVGASRAIADFLPTIPAKHFLYTDRLEDDRFWALTKVPPAMAPGASSRER